MWGKFQEGECGFLSPRMWLLALSLLPLAQGIDGKQSGRPPISFPPPGPSCLQVPRNPELYTCSFMLDVEAEGLRLKSGGNFIITIAIDHPQTARLVVTEPIPPNTGSKGAVAHFLPTVSRDRTSVKWVASSSSRVVKPVKSIPPGLPVFTFFVDNAADGTFTVHVDFDSTDAFDPPLEGPKTSSVIMEGGVYVEPANEEPEAAEEVNHVGEHAQTPAEIYDEAPEPEHHASAEIHDLPSVQAVTCDSWPVDGAMTVFGSDQGPAENNANNNMVGLVTGVLLRTDIAVEVTAIRYYKAASESGSPHTFTIYHNESQEVFASYVFNDSACEGLRWVSVALETPLVTVPSKSYLLSLHPVRFTAVTRGYFSRKTHANKTAGGVTLVSGAFGHDGENLFTNLQQVPTWNFWLDLEFRPALHPFPQAEPTLPPPSMAARKPTVAPAVQLPTPLATSKPKLDPVEAVSVSGPPHEVLDALDDGGRPTAPTANPGPAVAGPTGTPRPTAMPSAKAATTVPSSSPRMTPKPTLGDADSPEAKAKTTVAPTQNVQAPSAVPDPLPPKTANGSKSSSVAPTLLPAVKAPTATTSKVPPSVQPVTATPTQVPLPEKPAQPAWGMAPAVAGVLPDTLSPSGRPGAAVGQAPSPTPMPSVAGTKLTWDKPAAGSVTSNPEAMSTSIIPPSVAMKTSPSAHVEASMLAPPPMQPPTLDIAEAAAVKVTVARAPSPPKTRRPSTAPVANSASSSQPSSTSAQTPTVPTNSSNGNASGGAVASSVPSPAPGKTVPPTETLMPTASPWRSSSRQKKTLAPSSVDQNLAIKVPAASHPTDVSVKVTCNSFPINPEVGTVFSPQDRPSAASHGENSSRVMVGVRLWTSVPTDIYSIRYYRAAGEGADGHSAKIYEAATNELLVHVTFNDEGCTYAQWVDIPLPSPFRTRPQREYVVVVDSLVHYALTLRYFHEGATKTVKSISLLGSIFGSEPGAQPQHTKRSSSNYWIDVTFDAYALNKGAEGRIVPAEPPAKDVEPPKHTGVPTLTERRSSKQPSSTARNPTHSKEAVPLESRVVTTRVRSVGCDVFPLQAEIQTLFNRTQKPPRESPTTAAVGVVLGHVVAAVVPGNLTSFRFFKAKGEGGTDHSGRIYDTETGQLLASVTFNDTACEPPTWVTARLAPPLRITPDHEYVVALDSVLYYPETQGYISATLPRGSLRLLHSVYGSVSGSMPIRDDKKTTNYWIDVEFIRAGGGGADPSKPVNSKLMRRERRQKR